MAAITKLNDDKSANKHDEVINALHPEDVHFSTIQIFLKKIFDKVDESIDKTNTHTSDFLSVEMIQDIVGNMFKSNTETRISADYDDDNAKINLVVPNTIVDEDNMSSNSDTLAASQQSVKAYVDSSVAGIVDSAPDKLNTLDELAAALGDDKNYASTVNSSLASKATKANPTFTGTVAIPNISDLESAVTANTNKTGITNSQATAIVNNTKKTGITTEQANAISANSAKTGITNAQRDAIIANTAKEGITTAQKNAISANTSKTGITTSQANAITANTAKTGITTSQANAITANTAKVGITSEQIKAISANTAKVGITTEQARAITINSRKTGLQVGSQVKGFEIVDSIFLLIPGRNLGEFSLRIQMMVESTESGKSQAHYIDLPLQPGKGK